MTEEDKNAIWLNLDGIAYYFGKWYKGGPFDIGYATRSAFRAIDFSHKKSKQDFI